MREFMNQKNNRQNQEERIVEVKNLDFAIASNKILEDISLEINKGDFLGLVGPNGSGKTTLLKILLGAYKNFSGEAKIFSEEVKKFDKWQKIGYVAQNASQIGQFFPATVREIVGMGLLSKKKFPKIFSKSDNKIIDDALNLVGMKEKYGSNITQLSGGQLQRVIIARAIISQPELLILDEPTTGVDQNAQYEFYSLLDKLNKENGMTIIFVSHDIGVITKYVNKLAILNSNLVFFGTHDEFCKSETAIKFLTDEKHLLSMHHLS